MDESPELRLLFHRLNNQLGIILAHAELLEVEGDRRHEPRARGAGRSSTLEAMGTAKEIRRVSPRPGRTAVSTAKTVIQPSNC